ncbi:hypothetical protein K7432_005373 [Basidiobolus ranarum]|uniref:Ricin B lectin domain-containing protein n=1 Tax=Basidiobolus ranarum TaxID=34480 RepID=A0ABR2W452_9FUNG
MRSKLSLWIVFSSTIVYGSAQQTYERNYLSKGCETRKGTDGFTYRDCIKPTIPPPKEGPFLSLSGEQIESRLNHMCLEPENKSEQGRILMQKCEGTPRKQMIRFKSVKRPQGFSNLITHSGLCIESNDNGYLVQAYCQPNDPSQLWEKIFLDKRNLNYVLRNADTDQCLVAPKDTYSPGAPVSLYNCASVLSQAWLNHSQTSKIIDPKPLLETPVQLENGLNELKGKISMCLEISNEVGARAILKPCKRRSVAGNQLLTFLTRSTSPRSGVFRTASGLCLERSHKGYIIQKKCDWNEKQIFKNNSKAFYGGKERSIYKVGVKGSSCLDIQQGYTVGEVPIIATSCSSEPSQEWYNYNRDRKDN